MLVICIQDLEGWQSTKIQNPQKPSLMKFLSTPLIFLSSVLYIGHLKANPDQFVKLGGKITITKESDQWIKASVPFVFVTHPMLEKFKSRKPSSKEDLINIELYR